MFSLLVLALVCLASVTSVEARVTTTTEHPMTIVEDEKARDTTTEPPEILVVKDENQQEFFPDPDERIPDVAGVRVVGDMILTEEQWEALIGRKAITSLSRRWPEGPNNLPLIPYMFTDETNYTLDEAAKATVRQGISHWEENTCLIFEETTNTDQSHLLFYYEYKCGSSIGWLNNSEQYLDIGNDCNTTGIVLRYLGHTIGFFNEQMRMDRDEYVVIHPDNVASGDEFYFQIQNSSDGYGIPYDYGSVMHHGAKEHSKNGSPTISTIDPLKNNLIGQLDGLSFRDIHLANIIYNCTNKWLANCSISTSPCQNGGYIYSDCNCRCPPGTSGTNCETVTGDYYDSINDGCTEEITTPGTVSSPNFPSNFLEDTRMCTKVIKAPSCTVSQLNFTTFSLLPKMECYGGARCCRFNSLEIRNDYPNTSTAYCGTDIAVGQIFMGTSSQMVLSFDRTSSGTQGFSAELTFEPIPNCTTTTTTTTTMAPLPPSKCKVWASEGVFYWASPYFGVANYPNNFRCGILGRSSSGKRMVTFKIETFELETQWTNGSCLDYVKLNHLYDRTKTWCGRKDQQILFRSPTFNFRKEFSTDFSVTLEGFKISIIQSTGPNVNCHRTFYVSPRRRFMLRTPNMYSHAHRRNTLYCEYRIIAPSRKRINVRYLYTNLSDSTCEQEFLLLNGMKQRQYPAATSKLYCNNTFQHNVMTTSTNELIVAYQKDYNGASVRSSGAFVYFYVV